MAEFQLPTPLVSAAWLIEHLADEKLRIVDVRFSLADPLAGYMAYREGHIPGAVYLNLEADLSAPLRPDRKGGRHPLPAPEAFAKTLSQAGIGNEHWVVAYDDSGMVAPRLWWMLRWLGHDAVAVLDGGVKAYLEAGGKLEPGIATYPPTTFTPHPRPEMLLDAEAVAGRSADTVLIDSRAPERYRGEVEPLDPVAGHIPGAINRNWADGLDASGRFKPAQAQRARFAEVEGKDLIVYCGSGVSAAANLLALEVAGIKGARLYAGSWSDWVSDPSRPVAKGEEG
ncbi:MULTISPECIES: sulfurtransferase [unclassified Meiothermus]|uniref:sulfurtransferase n=1 Tax=unclassified Meiothermus TaxID=370471 RepID=UPI000D7C323B|nr:MULTISPECIES: sulfurtransferase [unclassified Meiothermus]PZA08892.1 sulfurtransferase [Meiothermus sp. Pnk-1]RYM33759.1 sulfurtransferase [Meiothermus sp. PNK-Is4]